MREENLWGFFLVEAYETRERDGERVGCAYGCCCIVKVIELSIFIKKEDSAITNGISCNIVHFLLNPIALFSIGIRTMRVLYVREEKDIEKLIVLVLYGPGGSKKTKKNDD